MTVPCCFVSGCWRCAFPRGPDMPSGEGLTHGLARAEGGLIPGVNAFSAPAFDHATGDLDSIALLHAQQRSSAAARLCSRFHRPDTWRSLVHRGEIVRCAQL